MADFQNTLTTEMQSAARALALSTGIACFYIDVKGRKVYPENTLVQHSFCSHCPYHNHGDCTQVYLYGRYQAERFGGKYIFFCPAGLTYCVSPILSENSDITAIFAGPLLMVDAENFLLEDFFPNTEAMGFSDALQKDNQNPGSNALHKDNQNPGGDALHKDNQNPGGDALQKDNQNPGSDALHKDNQSAGTKTISRDKAAEIKKLASELPVVSPERVQAISDLLYLAADSLSQNGLQQLNTQLDLLEKNAALSASVHALKVKNQAGEPTQYPLEKERELLNKISLGDKNGAQQTLNDILGYVFFATGRNFDIIRARAQELVVMLSRGAMEGGANMDEIFGLNRGYLNEIGQLKTVEELTVWLSKILARFTDCVFNLSEIRHKDVIFQTVNYVRHHYASHISLDDVAQHVHLNASYLSRVFKEEMQMNFVTYVNNVRIETSKKLLLDTSVPLLEVSGLVGFDEQSYFTKVFKKTTGVTPGKYREARGVPAQINKNKPPKHPNATFPHA